MARSSRGRRGDEALTRDGTDAATISASFVAGEESALAEAYSVWSSLVYSVALRSLGGVAEAEEVTQMVFIEAWGARHTFDLREAELPGWLLRITHDKISDLAAASTAQHQHGSHSIAPGQGSDVCEAADLADRLTVADEMSQLAPLPRQVIQIALSEDLSHAQIAERLGLPAGVVKSHLHRSLLTLRNRLGVLHGAH